MNAVLHGVCWWLSGVGGLLSGNGALSMGDQMNVRSLLITGQLIVSSQNLQVVSILSVSSLLKAFSVR